MPNFAAEFPRASQTLKLGAEPCRQIGQTFRSGRPVALPCWRPWTSIIPEGKQRHAAIPRRAGFPAGLPIGADSDGFDACREVVRRNAEDGVTWAHSVCHVDRPPQHLLHLRRPDTRGVTPRGGEKSPARLEDRRGPRPQSVFSSLKQLSEVPGCAAQRVGAAALLGAGGLARRDGDGFEPASRQPSFASTAGDVMVDGARREVEPLCRSPSCAVPTA